MALTLTEEIIRDRVNLTHENLEDVKALSLPGTYHEKFVSLGKALRKFARLKELDLSRNNLDSLEGLENLKLLEKLNLYYNNVGTMDELKRLKFNSNLKDIDLRLNPVTRNEPDYRLYLIHMLPNLQKLDDRGVRDRERQAALTHFSTSQATEMSHHPQVEVQLDRQPLPRVAAVNKLGRGSTVLDDDDVAVIDLVLRSDGDLNKPRVITGSNIQETKVVDYSLSSLTRLADKDGNRLDALQREMKQPLKSNSSEPEAMTRLREKYPNIPPGVLSDSSQDDHMEHRQDGLVKFDDEEEAYTKYKSHGYFTANPNPANGQDDLRNPTVESEVVEEIYPQYKDLPSWTTPVNNQNGAQDNKGNNKLRTNNFPSQNNEIEKTLEELGIPKYFNGEPRATENEEKIALRLESNPAVKGFLFHLLDVVDRYWNGSKSLHKHTKFKEQALTLVQKHFGEVKGTQNVSDNVQKQVARLKEENRLLRQQMADQSQLNNITSVEEVKIKKSFQQAQNDLEVLQEQVRKYANENKTLKSRLSDQEQSGYHGSGAASIPNPSQPQIEELLRKNDALSHEVEGLRVRLKQFAQLQELTNMLQESHTALVQTNEHLLKELEEEQHRHRHEVEQLHWSYDQLKKSLSFSRERPTHSRSYIPEDSEL